LEKVSYPGVYLESSQKSPAFELYLSSFGSLLQPATPVFVTQFEDYVNRFEAKMNQVFQTGINIYISQIEKLKNYV
jgi:hypothetical protein